VDELGAWCAKQVELWKLEIGSLEGGKMRVEELEGEEWTDITSRAKMQMKESLAVLQGILGRINAGVVTASHTPACCWRIMRRILYAKCSIAPIVHSASGLRKTPRPLVRGSGLANISGQRTLSTPVHNE